MKMLPWLRVFLALACLALAYGVAHEAWNMRTNRGRLSRAQIQARALDQEIARVTKDRDASLAAATDLTRARLAGQATKGETQPIARTLLERIADMKEVLARVPDAAIPEMRFLQPDDWIKVALETKSLASTTDFRIALASVRKAAKARVATELWNAYTSCTHRSTHGAPTDTAELAPYASPAIDPAILRRYEILPPERRRHGGHEIVIRERDELAIDRRFDAMTALGPDFGDLWLQPGERIGSSD